MSATVRALVAEIAADPTALVEFMNAIASCPTALAPLQRALGIELIDGVRYESRAKFAARWDLSKAQIDKLIKAGLVTGVRKVRRNVRIPVNAEILEVRDSTRLARAKEKVGLVADRRVR